MAKQNDVRDYERIAYVSGQRPGRPRWTELAVYHKADGQPPFVAEVVGATTYADEERRVKRNGGEDVDKAMRLFEAGGMRDEIITQVGDWLRRHEVRGSNSPTVIDRHILEELIAAAEDCARALLVADESLFSEFSHPGEKLEDDRSGYRARAARLRKAIEEVRNG